MNPLLGRLQPYPFERLRQLFHGLVPPAGMPAISLGMGEPRFATPNFLKDALCQAIQAPQGGLASYPATAGSLALRQACAGWVQRRYGVSLDAQTQVLPVNGSREALFAIAQVSIDPGARAAGAPPLVACPNPFYQIYEGAALLAGAETALLPCRAETGFLPDLAALSEADWARVRLCYLCTPGNPTGAVLPLEGWRELFTLADRHDFLIASDECYSEIHAEGQAPLGGLAAARALGREGYERLLIFTSLSKRSNAPGLRSGFVAGDAAWVERFLRYRTYHGSAMSPAVQSASAAAWDDEAHVAENRRRYAENFELVKPLLRQVLEVPEPDASFYLWPRVAGSELDVARELHAQYNVTVLPGRYLGRDDASGNPGAQRLRLALVAERADCLEAATRILHFFERHPHHATA